MTNETSIKEIGLSVFSVNALLANKITTVGDIKQVGVDNLIKYKRIGSRVANEVFSAIHGQKQKTVTLNDFSTAVKRIAHATNKRFFSVGVTLRENTKGMDIEFQCYVEKVGMFKGHSIESCISKLKESAGIVEIPKVVL